MRRAKVMGIGTSEVRVSVCVLNWMNEKYTGNNCNRNIPARQSQSLTVRSSLADKNTLESSAK